MKTSNKNSSMFVSNRQEFKANNLEGRIVNNTYVVYSYGWFPILIFDCSNRKWIRNENLYSMSTKKQFSQYTKGISVEKAMSKTELETIINS